MSLKDSSLSTRAPRWVCGRKKGSGCLFSKRPWERQGWLGTRESTSSPLNSPLLYSSTHVDESGPVDSKISHFVSLNFFYQQTEVYSDRGFQSKSMLSGPPWQRTWVGAENGAAERKTRAAAGQTESVLFPLQHQRCSPSRVPPLERSQRAHGASVLCLHRCLPSPGKLRLCKHAWPHASRRWMLTSAGCQGEKLRPTVGQGGFWAEQTQEGSQKGRQVLSPHWPLWLPGCLCLVRPTLDRDKTFGFFTSRDCSSFPSTTRSWSWSPGTVSGGGWASDPQPHLLGQSCQQWQGSGGRGRSEAWKTLSHTWKMSPGPTNTHSTLFMRFSSPYPVSPGKQTEKPKEKPSLFIYFCFFFFSIAQFQLLSAPMPQILYRIHCKELKRVKEPERKRD